jgi:exportin-5
MELVTANGPLGSAAAQDTSGENLGDLHVQIQEALKLVHSPYSSHQSRQDAQQFLEHVKSLPEAPSYGYQLASSRAESAVVRHYGLALLEYSIKIRWAAYTQEEAVLLRNWVVQLAQEVSSEDASFLRSKMAQLWVEVAKRAWVDTWMDMDEMLVRMWQVQGSFAHKELVLQILETLSDEVFTSDDPIVALREGTLSRAAVEIFTPASTLLLSFPNRQAGPNVRCGDEGWLSRITHLLNDCLSGDALGNAEVRSCAMRALALLLSLLPWAIPKAIAASGCVEVLCRGLAASSVDVQKASLEVLHALYARTSFTETEFKDLVVPMYDPKLVDLCRRLFEWAAVDPNDIDHDKYQFSKRFSEMISYLGNYLDRRYAALPQDTDILGYLGLLVMVVQSQSLVVSIPVMVTWTRLLHHPALGPMVANGQLIGPLLELCSSRLMRYDSLPEDTEEPTYVLLVEDTDTIPERHAFLGNYRRFTRQVIERIVQLKVSDAIDHILRQADTILSSVSQAQVIDPATYNKDSMQVLRVDAHFTVIEAALMGYGKWRVATVTDPNQRREEAARIDNGLESWSLRLLETRFADPMIQKRILQLLVTFSTAVLDRNAGYMLKVLEHILMTWPAQAPEHKAYNEAVKDLQGESMVELQRLAAKVPDHLLDVYDQLEAKVNEVIAVGKLDEKRQIAYRSFLFLIIHRATRIDAESRVQRLQSFIEPVKAQWREESLRQSLSSFDRFCELLCLDKAQRYLGHRQVHKISDWGTVELDAEGVALQNELEERQNALPLRLTKSFLTYSVEKVDKSTAAYQASCRLWQDSFPTILPELLRFLSYAHACHNPSNWTLLPEETRSVVGKVLTDRFWQAGISEGSKDEFYNRVVGKRNTLEGLASTIRGTVRYVRECCYSILYCMSRLDLQFYGFEELPGPLAHAMFADSVCLSAHQIINLINLVRYLVDHCPVQLREHFLPPLLVACFQQLDAKIKSEWDALDQRQEVQAAGDELTEEMKAESILRQLTYGAVVMMADFLDPARASK